jgi:AcrR family transcriptional regulator
VTTPPASQKITTAARRLLDRDGADAVTMRRIATAVGITPMAIYRHYQDRDALLTALADEGFQQLAARLARVRPSGDVEQKLKTMGELFLDHALENPRLFELMFLHPRTKARKFPKDFHAGQSPTANFIAETVREGMEQGIFRKDDVWEITFEIGALSHGLIMLYLGGRLDATQAQFKALYNRSFERYIRGIRK